MKKLIYVLMLFLPFTPNPLLAEAPSTDEVSGHMIGLFSNLNMNGETGDCGGYELWLFKRGPALDGQLAVYEGNCESEKKKIEDVRYNPKTGSLSFKAAYYSDDFFWAFKGTLKKDRALGTFSVFEKTSRKNTYNDKVILLKSP